MSGCAPQHSHDHHKIHPGQNISLQHTHTEAITIQKFTYTVLPASTNAERLNMCAFGSQKPTLWVLPPIRLHAMPTTYPELESVPCHHPTIANLKSSTAERITHRVDTRAIFPRFSSAKRRRRRRQASSRECSSMSWWGEHLSAPSLQFLSDSFEQQRDPGCSTQSAPRRFLVLAPTIPTRDVVEIRASRGHIPTFRVERLEEVLRRGAGKKIAHVRDPIGPARSGTYIQGKKRSEEFSK